TSIMPCGSAPAKPMLLRSEATIRFWKGVKTMKSTYVSRSYSRAGVLSLALGLLLALFLGLTSVTSSYAQTPAGDTATAAAASPPSCASNTDPKLAVTEKCTPNSGDTAWMLTSMALVLMMTVPGLGLFYGGMVRKKNVGDTVMTSFAVTCLVTVLWAVCTYSMAF